MFKPKSDKRKEPVGYDGVKVTGAGVVSVDSSVLIRHPKAQRQMEALRDMVGEMPPPQPVVAKQSQGEGERQR